MSEARFGVGDQVRRKSQPDSIGVVKEVEFDEQSFQYRYRVRFATLRGVPESDLELVSDDADPWKDAAAGIWANAHAFKTRLTYERLRKPPSRLAASFGSARAAFYPYQFKPLMKFLESEKQRLLIADDVGLGKTIEAGYILREMAARHGLERVLIIAPARLQTKWKSELQRRFDEEFEIVRVRDLLTLRQQLHRDEDINPFRWITSYESARDPRVTSIFEEYEPALDLVIFDEAHRLRNASTAQNAMARAVAGSSDALVFLTATPVQTTLDNLFELLHLLDPDEFASKYAFASQAEANRSVVQLANAIRSGRATPETLHPLLERIERHRETAEYTRTPYFASIRERAATIETLTLSERIELQRDVAELSLTSHVISRTRKAEVFENRSLRIAHTVTVRLTDPEKAVYASVTELCRRLRPDLSDWGLVMATLMAYRYTASCIPAALELFREKAGSSSVDSDLAAESEEGEEYESASDAGRVALRRGLVEVARAAPLITDSKFDRFADALRRIWDEDASEGRPRRKVVVFSYFKRTLRHLSRKLDELGIVHRRIDGDMKIPDREEQIEQFASQAEIRVLLSSEVGAEGLDLQFASVIVNYDLPWNPMVVEQRIGRIDRIGQLSPTVTIINLVADGTIEEQILMRLYERVRIFTESMGEIDPILGEKIDELTTAAITGRIPEEELLRRVDEASVIICEQQLQARTLGDDADALMAADQSFLDEIESMVGKRRVPLPEELFEFVREYVKKHPGSSFSADVQNRAVEVDLAPTIASELRRMNDRSPEASRVARKIEGGKFLATLDQKVALTHAKAELIHARHPLVRLVQLATEQLGDNARAFAVRLNPTTVLPAVESGIYVFSIWLFDIQGVRAKAEVVPFFAPLAGGEVLHEGAAESLYLSMLSSAENLDPTPLLDPEVLERTRDRVHQAARAARQSLDQREKNLNQARHLRKKATLSSTYNSVVRSARDRLEHLESKSAAPFALRMAQRRLERAVARRDAALAQLDVIENASVHEEEVAIGIVEVRADGARP